MENAWTITELAETAAQVLADVPARANGRVREVPNERLIRWYTTIGLVDPPLGRRGRTAVYGRRHLLQLVAVKRRQAEGAAIADVQAELTGATDRTLEHVARLPDLIPPPPGAATTGATPGATAGPVAVAGSNPPPSPATGDDSADRHRFWTASHPSHRDLAVHVDTNCKITVEEAVVLRLLPGVTVVLEGEALTGRGAAPGAIGAAGLAALQDAARPLIAELRRTGLLAPGDDIEGPAEPPAPTSPRRST